SAPGCAEEAARPVAELVGRGDRRISGSPRSDEKGAAGADGNPASDPSGREKPFAGFGERGSAVSSPGEGAAAAESERRRLPGRRGGEGNPFGVDAGVHREGCRDGDQRGRRCLDAYESRPEGSRSLAGEERL